MSSLFLVSFTLLLSQTSGPGTTRVSVDSAGVQGDHISNRPRTSADGRFVAFESSASNLVSGDNNATQDVFLHDRQTGQTTRISVDSAGVEGNSFSYYPALSADGRFIAFYSSASNLVPGDTNNALDVFVHDRQTGQTTRVSVDSAGVQGDLGSAEPAISADGRFVAFRSFAGNLVPGDTNGAWDIFVRDRQTAQTTRVSVSSSGVQANGLSWHPSLSAYGRYVAFESAAPGLVTGDTNNAADIFVHDRQTAQTTRVSMSSAGVQGNGLSQYAAISADGRSVAFWSLADNLVAGDTNGIPDVFVHDRTSGQTTRASVSSLGVQGDGDSLYPSISADGRFVAFQSGAGNLVAGDGNGVDDAFLHDLQTGETMRMSVDSAGGQANNPSQYPWISADARFVAFPSAASNLVTGDTNGFTDAFVRDRGASLVLTTTGTCPGPLTFTATGATPGGNVAFVWGTAGSFTIPGSRPCAGTHLDLVPLLSPPPGYLTVTANGSGTATAMAPVPPGACGVLLLQALDLGTCSVSNTAPL